MKYFFSISFLFLCHGLYSQMVTGSYTGDGSAAKAITGLGGTPDVVIIKGSDAGDSAIIRISTMLNGRSKAMSMANTLYTNGILSFDADGFTVGDNSNVNKTGGTYYYQAFGGGDGSVVVGSYVGNGTDNRSITGIGFQPRFMIVCPRGDYRVQFRTASVGGEDTTYQFTGVSGWSNRIQAFEADGFQIGTSNTVNASGITYHYAAWNDGIIRTGSYTGNGSSQSITGVGISSEYVIIKARSSVSPVHRSDKLPGSWSQRFVGLVNITTAITSLDADGFSVGSSNHVNTSGTEYHYIAFNGTTALPVELISFHAEAINDAVYIKWATASEINNEYFSVEKSGNAETYEEFYRVKGQGNSSVVSEYSAIDYVPYSVSYYRLKQTDYDGTEKYSKVISVKMNRDEEIFQISILPNPFNTMAVVKIENMSDTKNYQLEIYDLLGKEMNVKMIRIFDQFSIFSENLPCGIYFLQIKSEKEMAQKKIVVIK